MRRNNEPILLTGYSRGAAGVVQIANMLKHQGLGSSNQLGLPNVRVKAMLLFDCVDRHLGVDATLVPDNVENVLHVVRADATRSRGSFGHAAMKPQSQLRTRYPTPTTFHCTHAGMGGVPWTVPVVQSPGQLTLGGRIPPRQGPAVGRRNDFIVESFPDGMIVTTTVTYAQDAEVSAEVWKFVQPYILQHGF
jgi:hypothetical protein